MGKGSAPRPFNVSMNQFASNWDAIFKKGVKDVFQSQTENANGKAQGAAQAQERGEVLGDSQGSAVSKPPSSSV